MMRARWLVGNNVVRHSAGRVIAGLLCALVALVALGLADAHAQTTPEPSPPDDPGANAPAAPPRAGAWTRPVDISGPFVGWFPDVAADDDGRVHVVWSCDFPDRPAESPAAQSGIQVGADDTGSTLWRGGPSARVAQQVAALCYSRRTGETWSKPIDLALIWYGHALRSALTIDRTGRLHLVYKGLGELVPAGLERPGSLGPQDIWYTSFAQDQAVSVQALRRPTRITRAPEGYFSDIAIDRKGVIHVIWTESSRGAWGLYYSHSTDGGVTWSQRVALEPVDFVWWYRAQLKIDAQDRLHVVWELVDQRMDGWFGTTAGMVYAQSTDGGATWSRTRFPGRSPAPGLPGPGPQQPAIGVDGQGSILLVTREPGTNRIQYRRSSDGTNWSPPAPVPGIEAGLAQPFDVYDLVTDSAGHVHLVMVARPTGSEALGLLHTEWDGQGWASPDLVASFPPDGPTFPEYPRLALSGGNRLHLVWFERDRRTSDRVPIGIRYSSLQTSAPRKASEGQPPPEPAPVSRTQADQAPAHVAVQSPPERPARPSALPPDGPEESPSWPDGLRRRPEYPLMVAVAAVAAVLATTIIAKQVFARRLVRPY